MDGMDLQKLLKYMGEAGINLRKLEEAVIEAKRYQTRDCLLGAFTRRLAGAMEK